MQQNCNINDINNTNKTTGRQIDRQRDRIATTAKLTANSINCNTNNNNKKITKLIVLQNKQTHTHAYHHTTQAHSSN